MDEEHFEPEKDIQDVERETAFKKPILVGKVGTLPKKFLPDNGPSPIEISGKLFVTVKETPLEIRRADMRRTIQNKQKPINEQFTVTIPLQQMEKKRYLPYYKEPLWSGLPKSTGKDYVLEILKTGSIVDTINLMRRTFLVFGRVSSCDIYMLHPTISRFHVVLQYRRDPSETEDSGFYLYDLGSTHGTFLNKSRLKPKVYTRIKVGHMVKLGYSSRTFILNGPEHDEEMESEFTISELKQQRKEELQKCREEVLKNEREIEEKKKREEEKGVDWGLGEDADEETDLSENPFAQSNNEELYLDDPKKTLRGFFEREGLDLEYNCSEQGIGQFLCKVELPIDDDMGHSVVAEVLHKGKKKEAVVQCALEACRILDRYGVLRQATHESRKRKVKNWEENDYYDSDDDTYLDRTGTIEKKREKRMNAKSPQKAETYESLLEKENTLSSSILDIEKKLADIQDYQKSTSSKNQEEDSLDTFMNELKQSKLDKQAIGKLKTDLTKLKSEHTSIIRLMDLAKPANLPPLVINNAIPGTSRDMKSKLSPSYEKQRVLMVLHTKPVDTTQNTDDIQEEEENENKVGMDEEVTNLQEHHSNRKRNKQNDQLPVDTTQNADIEEKTILEMEEEKTNLQEGPSCEKRRKHNVQLPLKHVNTAHSADDIGKENEDEIERTTNLPEDAVIEENSPSMSIHVATVPQDDFRWAIPSSSDEEEIRNGNSMKRLRSPMTFQKFETILKKWLPPFSDQHQEKVEKILNNLKELAVNEDRMHVDWKMLAAKKRKVLKLLADMDQGHNEEVEQRVSSELNRIMTELNTMTAKKYKVIDEMKKMGEQIKSVSETADNNSRQCTNTISPNNSTTSEQANEEKSSENEDLDPDLKKLVERSSTSNESAGDGSYQSKSENEFLECEENIQDIRKKKNKRRINQRQEKAEQDKQRGYAEDSSRKDYSMWMPPVGQSGDGRTSLNDKYGY